VLAIDITREGFEWALAHSCLTAFDPAIYASSEHWRSQLRSFPVRVQWDPERTLRLEALESRTIQVGLSGAAVRAYVDEWIKRIEDVTELARRIESLATEADHFEEAKALAPVETHYPLPDDLARRVGCSPK
jgi:hypothetical protein